MILSDYWYRNAVIYALDVRTFMDSNGDGIGDFPGLIERLDYLAGLGVTCLWMLPFYPSPKQDNGYDVSDYYGVDPEHGTLGSFVDFIREARDRGMRVIMDLVVNHTSDQHPWFQASRSDPKSKYRDWYVWRKDKPDDDGKTSVVFPGEQDGIWSFDRKRKEYYLHHFYNFQPDLNIGNADVRDEILRIMGFWLELGVSGFRVDAAPFIIEDTTVRAGGPNSDGKPGYQLLHELRNFLERRRGDAILLAEANVEAKHILKYFGEDGERFHMLFNFIVNQELFLAIHREDPTPLIKAFKRLPDLPANCQWANFVRNHDELTLDKLSEKERNELFDAYAPDPSMRIYNRGIRRRMPSMLNGDRRQMEMVYSLLFTLPGTPIIRYGEEIGMGDDQNLKGRDAVRTPMQWTSGKNGGFSTAKPKDLARPVMMKGPFGAKDVNVEAQERDRNSLMNHVEQMIRIRKHCPEFGWGDLKVIETNHKSVLAHAMTFADGCVLAVHNLSSEKVETHLKWDHGDPADLVELLSDEIDAPLATDTSTVKLNEFGYRWFRVKHGMKTIAATT